MQEEVSLAGLGGSRCGTGGGAQPLMMSLANTPFFDKAFGPAPQQRGLGAQKPPPPATITLPTPPTPTAAETPRTPMPPSTLGVTASLAKSMQEAGANEASTARSQVPPVAVAGGVVPAPAEPTAPPQHHAHSLDVKDIVQMAQSVSEVSSSTSPPDGSVGFDAGASPPTSAFGGDSRDAVGGQASGEGGPPILALPRSSSPEHDAVGLEAAVTPDDPASKQLQELLLGSGTNTSGANAWPKALRLEAHGVWVGAQTLRLLLFTGSEASDECQERRDITATGSIYTYVSLGDARNFLGPPEGFLGAASADSLFVYVVCSEPCKPHLTAHLNSLSAADTNANKIRCGVWGVLSAPPREPEGASRVARSLEGPPGTQQLISCCIARKKTAAFFSGLSVSGAVRTPQTLSKKQQVATSSDLQVSSPFVLLAAWDCVPQTVTEVEDKWYDGSSEEDSEEAAAGAQCETIGPQGTIGGTVYLSARLFCASLGGGDGLAMEGLGCGISGVQSHALFLGCAAEKDGVLHVLVHLRAYMKASQDFILSVGAPTAITAVSMEQSLDIIMPENSLRLFSFKFEESAFDPAAYCTPQLVPQREGKDKYHPFLVTAFALDGEPPGIACCNASRETHPDPALSTKEQPECWRTNEAEYNGLVALRVRTDHRRAQAPYGEFICGVRSREASHALFRLTLSSESSKQDPRLFEILDIDNVTFLSLIPYSQSCHYEHAAFSTDKSGGPLTLKLTKQKGPSPAETCVFPCQSALTPLAICSVRMHAWLQALIPDFLAFGSPGLRRQALLVCTARLCAFECSFSLLLHRQSAADAHVSSVMLHNGVPFFARLQGDWHGGRAFRFGKVDGREGYKAPPIASEAGETGDLSCTLMVTQAHLKDLEAADSPLAFHLSLVTSDTLTDAYVFPPGATVPYTFDANRLTPLSAVIRLERKHAESALQVDPEKAVGLWKILFSTATKDSPVSLQITASVGALADGSVRVHRSPKLQVIESRAQHLMDGVHVAEDISADPSDPNHRKIFIFPLTFSLELAGGVPVESAMRCAATRFGATSVRLFANAVTWGDTEVPKGFKAFPAEAYKLPLPEDPKQGEGSTQLGLEAAYVIVAEGFNSTHAANPVAPDPENRGPSLPETKAPNTAAAAQAAAATPTDAQYDKFSITCSFLRHAIPLAIGEPAEGFLGPEEERLFVLQVLNLSKDIILTLTSGAVGDAGMYVGARRDVSNLNVESGADAFVAVEKAANLRDLTPLSEGSAQWWTDGLASPDIKIHHTKVALQQRALSCTFPDSQAEVAVTEQVSQATKVSQALDLCVLRIDVASPVPQPFSITLDGSHSSAIPVTPIASGAPVRGVLHRGSTDYFRIDLHPTLIETDEDAALKIALESTGCGVSLSLRWPDGEVKAWPYPDNRQIIVTRRARPWTEGFFLLLVRGCVPPLCSGSLVMSTLALCLFASSCRPVGYARKFVVSWPFKANIYSPVAPIKAVRVSSAEMCSYELLAKIEASASESPPARVLRTGFPVRGTIRAGIPERFVWSPSVVSEKADAFANELLTLRATSVTHSIDVYAARLQPEQGFPQQPPPGSDPPPGVFKLQPYSDDPNTLYLNIGHAWALVGSEDFETACAPSNLREAKGLKGGMSDEDGPLQSVASCQLLISVFDRHAQEQDMPRDVDFTLVATSRLKDYFIQCAFEEPLDLVLQMFLQTNGVKVLLLSLDNVSADVSLRLTSSDAKLIKEMSAWLDYSESLLSDPSPYSEKRCVLPDRSEGHEPLLQFVARQQGNFIPLRDNHDEAVYSVEAKAPKFFSFETTVAGGYLIVSLDVDIRSVSYEQHGRFKKAAQDMLQSLSVFVQSCNNETFGRSMWSSNLRPSASLYTDTAYLNEYNQLVAVVENNMHQYNSPVCQYRIGVYSTSPSPVFFRMRASLQHQSTARVLPLGLPMLGYISRKPQMKLRRAGSSAFMFIADYFAIRVWKPANKSERLLLSVQVRPGLRGIRMDSERLVQLDRRTQGGADGRSLSRGKETMIGSQKAREAPAPLGRAAAQPIPLKACSGGVGFGWGTNKVQVRIQAEKNPWFLGTLKSIERSQTQEILAKQGLISLVVPSSSLNYVGASVRAASHYRSEGFTGGKSSSFSIRIDPLDSVICLGAENIDVNWRLRTATWLPRLWGEESKRLTADIWWSPLMAVPAVETVIESSSDSGDWGCASHDVAVRGSAVPPDSVEYELFVAKTDKVQGNWLSSCGMYQDTFLLGAAEKISIPEGVLAYSLDLDFESGSGYRIGLVAKYVIPGTAGVAQPFAYRFSEIPPDVQNQGFRAGSVSIVVLLIVLAVIVVLVCKLFRRGPAVAHVFQGILSTSRMKTFSRAGKSTSRLPSDGLELTRTVNSSYGPVPITIGCVDEGPMHEGDPVDVTARVADLPGMGETPWLFCDRS
ncbi:uncharacterized protein LOC34617345 [Cyclospora cayetanensis]|uniref:Uncharacterized protein LOC34617345 n=1 Tax=Cyclospora cayetanensis TaxID=88456 RepID=A0A6P6S0A2_9EIME|nr:uncharacterized protein LOC34617345 [Cyclospora cayetanensis]